MWGCWVVRGWGGWAVARVRLVAGEADGEDGMGGGVDSAEKAGVWRSEDEGCALNGVEGLVEAAKYEFGLNGVGPAFVEEDGWLDATFVGLEGW